MISQVKPPVEPAVQYAGTNQELMLLKVVKTTFESYAISRFAMIGSIFLFTSKLFIGLYRLIGNALGKQQHGFFMMASVAPQFYLALHVFEESVPKSRLCDVLKKNRGLESEK